MGAEMFSESKKKRRIRQSVLCDRQSSEQEIGKIYHQRYQVRKILGEGGMGKVFLALDQKTGKEVAVKIVKDQKQWDRERVILQKLKHTKGVPELFFAGKEKELFLVMEYISSIIAVSARDSILMNIFNAKDFYCVLLMCIWGHFVIKIVHTH